MLSSRVQKVAVEGLRARGPGWWSQPGGRHHLGGEGWSCRVAEVEGGTCVEQGEWTEWQTGSGAWERINVKIDQAQSG